MKNKRYKINFGITLKSCVAGLLILSFLLPPAAFAEVKNDKRGMKKAYDTHLEEGKRYYRDKLYREAIKEWEKAIELFPEKKAPKKLIKKAEKLEEKSVKFNPPEITRKNPISVKHKLTLEECIDIAMENHLPLKIATKQLKLAEFRIFEAQRKLGPKFTAKYEQSVGVVDEKSYDGSKISGEIKQPIFYGGELIYAIRQAKVNADVVRTEYERIKNELVLQVKKAYYSLDKAKKALGVQSKLYNRTERFYDIARTGYGAGVIAQIEFLKVGSQYNQANFQLISAGEDIELANLILEQAMNIDEDIEIAEVKEPRIIKIDLENCYDLAYLNRPEIKIKQLSLDYFGYEKKIHQARANWPRVDFLGMYGNAVEDYKQETVDAMRGDASYDGLNPRTLGPEWYYGFKVSVPFWGSTLGYSYTQEQWQPVVRTVHETLSTLHVFSFDLLDKLEDISSAKEAELEGMRAQDEINKNIQEINLEVKETFFKYKKSLLLMQVAKSKVEFQAKQVEVLEVRQGLGEAQYSDVIEEMVKLAEEEFALLQAIADYFISVAILNKAIGIDSYFEV